MHRKEDNKKYALVYIVSSDNVAGSECCVCVDRWGRKS